MREQVRKDLAELEARRCKLRLAELMGCDVPTLAEFGLTLENMNHSAKVRIEELEEENAELRQDLAACQGSSELVNVVYNLAGLLAAEDELTRRARLLGDSPDESLRDELIEGLGTLLGLVAPVAGVDVNEVYDQVRV